MKLVIIFGPQAVGKMTVGQKLEEQTGLKLFHNHMTIELVSKFFSYGTEQGRRLVNLFRKEIFEEVAKSDLEGMIFTFLWAFDDQGDWDYINGFIKIFEDQGADIFYAELEADLKERLERNKSENRLLHKPTKRNAVFAEKNLLESMEKFRLNSNEGELKVKNYIRIDNTNLSPEDTASKIKEVFDL